MSVAKIVVGLQYGDEGKGITTDYLCSLAGANKIVVRFSGGQQAAHNVSLNGQTHIHSNYGSGTLRGIPSYFTEHCTVYPVNMLIEKRVLMEKGVDPVLTIHPLAKLTTPFDVIYNRIIETRNNHGSCGKGIGTTMDRNLNTGYKLHAIDLANKKLLEQKLINIYYYYRNKLEGLNEKREYNLACKIEQDAFNEAMDELTFDIKGYDYLKLFGTIIFEGSQGIMLDMDFGIFPNVTYSNTTSKNALEICEKLGIVDKTIYYVTRCYQTRHGNGWMSNEGNITLINNENETNSFNEWQKNFRTGEIDYDQLNFALDVDNIYSKGVDKKLMITCNDQRPDFKFDYSKLNTEFRSYYKSFSPEAKSFKQQNVYLK
jgi:adenylosuccinate synthase